MSYIFKNNTMYSILHYLVIKFFKNVLTFSSKIKLSFRNNLIYLLPQILYLNNNVISVA